MVFSTRLSLAALAAAAVVSAQTPTGANPSTDTPLGLKFGSTDITPNGLLISQSRESQVRPKLSLDTS